MAYYRRIRELREDNDKTQKEIADYLGTAYQYYAVYEKGTSEISFERAIMLAKYYNVSLDYIAGLTDKKISPKAVNLSREQTELINILDGVPSETKMQLLELLDKVCSVLK